MDRRLDAIADELTGGTPLAPLARDELKLLVYERASGHSGRRRWRRRSSAWSRAGSISPGRADAEAGLGRRSGLEREAVRAVVSRPGCWRRSSTTWARSEALALAEAMNRRAPLAIRVNTARDHPRGARGDAGRGARGRGPTPLSPVGLRLETRVNAFGLSAFRDGLFEVMDEGSQLVAELVAPPPGGACSTPARAPAARRWRWARCWAARGGCWRSTPTARSWRSCAAAPAAPA